MKKSGDGDAVTLPSKGYFLKLVFMFISGIIMNIFMFNCCLNINKYLHIDCFTHRNIEMSI
jgi:hypothetical protein